MASSQEKLYVTHVDIDRDLLKIWGQRNRIGATYIERQLLQLLPDFNKTPGPNPGQIHKGMFCFAKYTDDNYYRARVISRVQDDSVGVLFVDYGNRDIIKLSNIRIQEGNEGDVLAKMSEQAEEYYLAQIAAPLSGWSMDIVSEIRREICYEEFHYQIIVQVGDQNILNIQFRDEDFSSYLVKKQLARSLSLPVQKELILSYCSLVSNDLKQDEAFGHSPRLSFLQSVSPSDMRAPLGSLNTTSDINMHSNHAKTNKPVHFSCSPSIVQQVPLRHLRTSFQHNDSNIPKDSYFTPVNQINNHMPLDSNPIEPVSSGLNSLVNPQLNQFYQAPGNAISRNNNNNNNNNNYNNYNNNNNNHNNNFNNNNNSSNNKNLIEIIAQQVKQYIVKDEIKSEAEKEIIPHHYVNSVLEVGSTYNVIISHIDDGPWSFSIQLLPKEEELKKLIKDLSSVELIPIKPPIILGHPCIAISALHGTLCRGVVVSISRSAVKVYFVDFGNTEDLLSSLIYELPPKFFKVAVLSQKFSLSGLQKVTYCDDIKKFFEEAVRNELLVLRVDSLEDDNLPTCELYLNQRNIKRILNEKMKESRSSGAENLPEVGDTESVLVTWVVSPQKFFVQMKKRDAELKALKKELSEVENKGQALSYQQLSVGFKCVCLYEMDEHWYRVVITSVDSENAITVFYIDYGNTETVRLAMLRKIDGSCLINQMGSQAVQCCLKGFENQHYDAELSKRLETLILEKEFQMTVASSEKQLLCVNLYDSGTDITALLMLMQPTLSDTENLSLSIESSWNSPESKKAVIPNKFEKENTSQVNNFFEKKSPSFQMSQTRKNQKGSWGSNFQCFQSSAQASRARFKSRWEGRESGDDRIGIPGKCDYWGEEKSDEQTLWKTGTNREFGNWDSSKPGGSGEESWGWEGPSDCGTFEGDRESGRSRIRVGKYDGKSSGHGDRKSGESRGRRQDEDRRPDVEGKRFGGSRGRDATRKANCDGGRNKSSERQFSRVPIRKENTAPPGSKFQEKLVKIGSCERGIVTYYFGPDEFFVQLLNENLSFREMMKDIQTYYGDKYSIRDPVEAGDIVIAQFSVDKVLYRAEVIKPSPVTVRYVDYGNQEPVQPKGIWFVDKKFLELPQQVVKCRLAGLQPIGSHWPPPGSPVDKFFQASEYKCTFVRKEGDIYEIEMESMDSGKDVACEIAAAGLGRMEDPELNILDIPETDYSLLQSQTLSLHVSHVESSKEFYVVIDPDASAAIAETISTYVEKKKSFCSPEPGAPCLASPNGDTWYRGNVIEIDGNSVRVRFTDRGDSVVRPKEEVMHLPDSLKKYQPQVAQCCLNGMSGVGDEEYFKKVVEHRTLLVHIMSVTDNRLSVILYDEEGLLFDFEEGCDGARAIEPIGQLPIKNQLLSVVISHVETVKEIYIQSVGDEEKLMNFLDQMKNFYSDGKEGFQGEDISEGTLVAANSKIYDSWYRGRVISCSDEEFEVFYIDYGNREVLPRRNVRKLDSSLLGTRAFCRRVALDVDDSEGGEIMEEKLWKLCDCVNLRARFKNKSGEIVVEFQADGESVANSPRMSNSVQAKANELIESSKSDENKDLKVFVSHIDRPDCFWVHKETLINELQEFQERLQKSCETLADKKVVEVNDVVAAVFSGMWYRARVIKVQGTDSTVQYIDYGNTSVVDLKSETVKELTPDLLNAPVFATRLALKGNWGKNSTSKFEEIILRNEDPVCVTTVEETDPAVVDLFQNGRSIADMLLEEMAESEIDGEDDHDLCTVYITHSISPDNFYVQRETSTEALVRLTERLCDAHDFENPVSVEEGQLYAAKYPEDGDWYRARVTVKTAETTTVLFIDYGNTCAVDELKCLPSDVVHVPSLSENCCLVYGKDTDSWSESACDMFAEYADGRALRMKVVASAGRKNLVKLFYGNKNISQELEAVCEKDGRVEMYVSHAVSPRDFYVRYVNDEEYTSIEEAMEEEGDDLEERKEGMVCQALFEEDGLWYRGRILRDLGPEGCEVFFLDFGNTGISKELKKLPKNMENLPPRALKCSLDLNDGGIAESVKKEFVKLTGGGTTIFRGRILKRGETNLISLKMDGRILEKTLNVIPREGSLPGNHEIDEEDFNTVNDGTDVSSEIENKTKTRGKDGKEGKTCAGEDSLASKEVGMISAFKETENEMSSLSVVTVPGSPRHGGSFNDHPNRKVRNKVHKIVPGSISGGEKEEDEDEEEKEVDVRGEIHASCAKLKITPGFFSREASLESVSGGRVTGESQSAPKTSCPSPRNESIKKSVDARLVQKCQSAAAPAQPCSSLGEKTSPGEKIVPGAVNGSQNI